MSNVGIVFQEVTIHNNRLQGELILDTGDEYKFSMPLNAERHPVSTSTTTPAAPRSVSEAKEITFRRAAYLDNTQYKLFDIKLAINDRQVDFSPLLALPGLTEQEIEIVKVAIDHCYLSNLGQSDIDTLTQHLDANLRPIASPAVTAAATSASSVPAASAVAAPAVTPSTVASPSVCPATERAFTVTLNDHTPGKLEVILSNQNVFKMVFENPNAGFYIIQLAKGKLQLQAEAFVKWQTSIELIAADGQIDLSEITFFDASEKELMTNIINEFVAKQIREQNRASAPAAQPHNDQNDDDDDNDNARRNVRPQGQNNAIPGPNNAPANIYIRPGTPDPNDPFWQLN